MVPPQPFVPTMSPRTGDSRRRRSTSPLRSSRQLTAVQGLMPKPQRSQSDARSGRIQFDFPPGTHFRASSSPRETSESLRLPLKLSDDTSAPPRGPRRHPPRFETARQASGGTAPPRSSGTRAHRAVGLPPRRPIKTFRTAWKTATVATSCPGRIPHNFRRTAVRNLVRAGVPERVVMRMTGHSTRFVFDRYHIVSQADHDEAALKLAGVTDAVIAADQHCPTRDNLDNVEIA